MSSLNSRDNRWDKANFVLNATNAVQLLQLRNQQAAMNRKFDLAQQQQAERSFAHWRQTPDGKWYEEWKAQVSPLVVQIFQADEYWKRSSEKIASEAVSDQEREKDRLDLWTKTPVRHSYAWISLGIALLSLVGLFLCIRADLWGLGRIFALVLIPAFVAWVYISIFGTFHSFWKRENELAKKQASAERVRRLGFDPLSSSDWPINIWENGCFNQAHRIADIVANEVAHHPSPQELISLSYPVVVPYSKVPVEQLHPVLKDIKASFPKESR